MCFSHLHCRYREARFGVHGPFVGSVSKEAHEAYSARDINTKISIELAMLIYLGFSRGLFLLYFGCYGKSDVQVTSTPSRRRA